MRSSEGPSSWGTFRDSNFAKSPPKWMSLCRTSGTTITEGSRSSEISCGVDLVSKKNPPTHAWRLSMPVHEHVQHEHFEELCALAALGQISAEDFAEFQAHLIVCAPCRTEHADYIDLLHTKGPLIDSPPGSFGKLHSLVPQRN